MKKTFVLIIACLASFIFEGHSQNVGIGTINPTRAKLEVSGAVDATSAIFGSESSGISLQRNWPGIGFNSYWNGGNRNLANGYSGKIYFDPNNGYMFFDMLSSASANAIPEGINRALVISPQGNIALGGASLNGQLQFPNTFNKRKLVLWESANNDNQFYGLGIEPGTLTYSIGGTDNVHKFYCGDGPGNAAQLMTIGGNKKVVIGTQAGTGRLGINSADPMYSLEVVQADHTGIVIIDPNTWNHWELKTEQVGPNGNYLFFRYNAVGTSFIQPDGSYHDGSDYRLKENIQPMPDLLQRLMQLNPKTYTMKYNNPNKRKSIGLIAQDLQEYFPELVGVVNGTAVGYKDIPDLHTINYGGLSVLAIKAIQEQQQQIERLKKEIELLKEEVGKH